MNNVNKYRRPVRIVEYSMPMNLPHSDEIDSAIFNSIYPAPPVVKMVEVQVKFIFWHSIWGESTDENNTDQLGIIHHRAEKVAASIESEQ